MSQRIPTIIPIQLMLANVYLVRGERWILVDTGGPGDAGHILRAAARHGIQPREIGLILLTHGHVDHFGSAADLRRATGAPIALHAADAGFLQSGRNPDLLSNGREARMMRPFLPWETAPVVPDISFEQELDLGSYGIDGQILHTPGHSPGSISVLLPGGIAIAGDILRGGYAGGRVLPQLPNPAYFVDHPDQLRTSVATLVQQPISTIYVGHGGSLQRDTVLQHLDRIYPAPLIAQRS